MKNILVLMFFVSIIFILLELVKTLIENKKLSNYKKHILENKDETELKLMIGYNYVSNLNKLDSIINEIISSNISKEKLDYMERIIDKTNEFIYGNDIIEQTTFYENEYLYKNTIINLDIIFYAFKFIFKEIKNNDYKIFNNKDILNNSIESGNKEFQKKVEKLFKKGKKLVKNKKGRKYYYNSIDKIKNEYKVLIDNSNPISVMFFIKDSLKKISESC